MTCCPASPVSMPSASASEKRTDKAMWALRLKKPDALELRNRSHNQLGEKGYRVPMELEQISFHRGRKTMAGKKKTEDLPLFLTPEQAAKISGLGVNRIRQLMDEGQLEYLPVGNRRLTTVQALLDYYDRAKVPIVA